MDDMIQEKVAQKANELHATYDERIRNFEERCVLFFSSIAGNSLLIQRARSSEASHARKYTAQGPPRIARLQSSQTH